MRYYLVKLNSKANVDAGLVWRLQEYKLLDLSDEPVYIDAKEVVFQTPSETHTKGRQHFIKGMGNLEQPEEGKYIIL